VAKDKDWSREQPGIYGAVQRSIIEYRAATGLSQGKLALILGVGKQVIADWEHGRKAAFKFLWRTWWQGSLEAAAVARAILAGPLAAWPLDTATVTD
jgi:hypothetical protein